MVNWYDEDEVVKTLKDYLQKIGYVVRPKWVKTGPDIEAEIKTLQPPLPRLLIVEAKGYPTEYYVGGKRKGQPKPTKPDTQARHWVADAIFTTLLRLAEHRNEGSRFALAFPRFPIYINLMNRLKRVFREKFNIIVFLVEQDKNVKIFFPQENLS